MFKYELKQLVNINSNNDIVEVPYTGMIIGRAEYLDAHLNPIENEYWIRCEMPDRGAIEDWFRETKLKAI